jgi:hypothetical protein
MFALRGWGNNDHMNKHTEFLCTSLNTKAIHETQITLQFVTDFKT